jgi:hypothetical protein
VIVDIAKHLANVIDYLESERPGEPNYVLTDREKFFVEMAINITLEEEDATNDGI